MSSTNPAPALRYYYSPFSSSPPSSSSSSSGSFPMVVITVVGILAAFALLASYYAFVTRCQLLRSVLSSSLRNPAQGQREEAAAPSSTVGGRGLGLPLIRMLPVVKFAGGAEVDAARRVSVSTECAVCLSEFAERERVRLLPNCSHAFHIDCIDTWLQGSAQCPFCRSDVTMPWPVSTPPVPSNHNDDEKRRCRRDDELMMLRAGGGGGSIVIEVRGEHESWDVHNAGARTRRKAESVGDEAIDTRRKKGEEFAVMPMRRSLSMDSSCGVNNQLCVSAVVRELLTHHRHA